MKFSEYIQLSESMKDLASAIGHEEAQAMVSKPKDAKVRKLHDSVFGKDNHHIEVPVKPEIPKSVVDHVTNEGDKIHEDGEHVVLSSGRHAPISKYLAKSNAPKEVQDEYQNYSRHKLGDSKLVISRKPTEVATASICTNWTSCANNENKDPRLAWRKMPSELKHGTLIAMHVSNDAKPNEHGEYDGKDIKGRVLLKRHDGDDGDITFRPEERSYGKFGKEAHAAVNAFADKHYPMKDVVYTKHKSLYDDDKKTSKLNDNASKQTFDKYRNKKDTPSVLKYNYLLKTSPHITDEIANHEIEHPTLQSNNNVVQNPHLSSEKMHDVIDNHPELSEFLQRNKSLKAEHITKMIDKGHYISPDLHSHPALTSEHIDSLMDVTSGSRNGLIQHPKLSDKWKDKILATRFNTEMYQLAGNPTLQPKHIDKILDTDYADHYTKAEYIKHKNASEANISKALKNEKFFVAKVAAMHPKATEANIDEALHHNNSDVGEVALKNKNVTVKNLDTALKHKSEDVRWAALSHHKATPAQLMKASEDGIITDSFRQKRLKDFIDKKRENL